MPRRLLLLSVMILTAVPVSAAEVTLEEIRQLRHEAAGRKRRIVVHSDGVSMDPKKRFLESGECVLPYLPGTRTDACTYSLIHQFPVVRLYRSKVGQEWPPGIIKKMYGDGPDGLETYIEFCRKNDYEAFWAMRTNDTHDAGGDAHGLRRWNSNRWKQAHPEYLVASREKHHTPYGQWSAYDYAHPEVREKVFRVLEEVCLNYDVDGLLLDFFRHLPTLKTTVGGGEAGEEELAMITSLFCRTREMMDQIGAKRGRPILLAVRTPDSLGYCRALGLDVQRWMKDKLIDIWIVTGYFRLQEWHETVKIGHQYGVQVWASMDESRVQGRDGRNSLEAYRARITNAFYAGVDAVWLFNFFYYPKDPQFKLLTEAGDPATLAHTDKMYVADARGQDYAGYYLEGGQRFFTRPPSFSPKHPVRLETGKPQTVNLPVGDDVQSARAEGFVPRITLAIQASPGSGHDDLAVQFNGQTLADPLWRETWVNYTVKAAALKQGTNRIEIVRGSGSKAEPILRDLQLWIKYEPAKAAEPQGATYGVRLRITSKLPCAKVPMDPMIDFASLIEKSGAEGVLDPNSIEVVDVTTGKTVECAPSEDFAYGQQGRVQWVVEDPAHKEYEIRFRTDAVRPPLLPRKQTPMIGTGDVLRYNADAPRPFPPINGLGRLIDLTGDGRRDLVGSGAYAYAPGRPFSGIFCYPRTGGKDTFEFGDLVRVRYLAKRGSTDFKHFTPGYMHADVADLNGDGLPDVIFTSALKSSQKGGPFPDVHKYIHLYLNSGERDAGGMPVFVLAERLEHPADWWGPVRAVDLNGDGAVDFVVGSMFRGEAVEPDPGGYYIENTNPKGWPIRPAEPVKLDLLKRPCFYDIDGDGTLDCVGLIRDPKTQRRWENRVAWRKNLGGDPATFGPPKMLDDINVRACNFTAAVNEGLRRGLLVSHNHGLSTAFFEQEPRPAGEPRFVRRRLVSDSAVIAGESNGCYPCDWDADGDWDILTGSCYGCVRIWVNSGSSRKPVFDEPREVFSEGKPIDFRMTKTFPDLKRYGHDLGYALPVFIDWDGDGMTDLMLPNLSNRIFWCKNIGSRREPKFGPLQQVICDGYAETKETLKAAAVALSSGSKSPHDPTQPFWWRSRAAFGDLTGDGLPEMITADATKTTKLFVQYRDASGRRKLREAGPVKLPSGDVVNSHIPPQYFLVDWDGDGLLDLIYKHGPAYQTDPAVARNIGTKTDPKFDTPVTLFCYGQPTDDPIGHIYYGVRDLDGDGKPDFLISSEMGTFAFYRHTALDMPRRPEYELGDVRRH